LQSAPGREERKEKEKKRKEKREKASKKGEKTFVTSEVTLEPKSQPAPRGLTAQVSMSSGSDHMRSTKNTESDKVFPNEDFLGGGGVTTEGALVGNLLAPLNGPDLIKGADVRGQTTVDTENPAIDHLKGGEKVSS